MHTSRLGAIVIDCQTQDFDEAVKFWSQALGCKARKHNTPGFEHYAVLEGGPHDPRILVQKVDHPSRIHLDIETDDVAAEIDRMEELGARKVGFVHHWCVMEAPSGQRFCIIDRAPVDDQRDVNEWP